MADEGRRGVLAISRQSVPAVRGLSAEPATEEQLKAINACVAKVTEETEGMRFNTAIAAMMEFTNAATKWDQTRGGARTLAPLLPLCAAPLGGAVE